MKYKSLFLLSVTLFCSACDTLLESDFDNVEGDLFGAVDLPGSPNGDRMIVTAPLVQTADFDQNNDRSLVIFRGTSTPIGGVVHGGVFFDPIDAGNSDNIFFSWTGELLHDSSGSDLPIVDISLRDLSSEDTPNLFSKLKILYGPQKLAIVNGSEESPIGLGVSGPHGALLRIEPSSRKYWVTVNGEGVSPGGTITTSGTIGGNVSIDPNNIGLSISFDSNIDAGISRYVVERMKISKRGP